MYVETLNSFTYVKIATIHSDFKTIKHCLCSVVEVWKRRVQMWETLSHSEFGFNFYFCFQFARKAGFDHNIISRSLYWNLHLHECGGSPMLAERVFFTVSGPANNNVV